MRPGSLRTGLPQKASLRKGLLIALLTLPAAACGVEPSGRGQPNGDLPVETPGAAAATTPGSAAAPGGGRSSPSGQASETSGDPGAPEPGLSGAQPLAGAEAADLAGLDPAGAVAGLQFRDANGVNIVVLRTQPTPDGARLLADHVALFPMTEEREVLREVRDQLTDCSPAEGDATAEFMPGSLEVVNHDDDDLGEVVFAYRLACRTDVSPAQQKLLLLEDGEKHILRGRTATPYEPVEAPVPEPAAERWPDGAFSAAVERFRELAPEFVPTPPSR